MTLLELFQLMRKHLKLVILLPIAFAVIVAFASWFFLANTYTANVSMYVLANSSGEQDGMTLSTDLSASQMITNDVAELIDSERVREESADRVGIDVEELNRYRIQVTSSSTTRLIGISVTGAEPESTAAIANSIANTTNTVAQEIMDIEAVNVIDEATVPSSPSGPNRPLYIAAAFVAGILAAVVLVVLMDLINTRIRRYEEIEELLNIPVVGRIPVMK